MIGMQSEAQVLSPLDYGQLSRHPDPLLHHISMKSVHEYPRNNRRRGFGNPAHAVRNSQNGAASSVDRDQKTSGILHSAITELLEKCILPFGENRRTLRRMVDQLEARPTAKWLAFKDESGFADEKPTTGKLIYAVKNYLQHQKGG